MPRTSIHSVNVQGTFHEPEQGAGARRGPETASSEACPPHTNAATPLTRTGKRTAGFVATGTAGSPRVRASIQAAVQAKRIDVQETATQGRAKWAELERARSAKRQLENCISGLDHRKYDATRRLDEASAQASDAERKARRQRKQYEDEQREWAGRKDDAARDQSRLQDELSRAWRNNVRAEDLVSRLEDEVVAIESERLGHERQLINLERELSQWTAS
jgi:chromosome segregation ATPase